MNPGVQAVIAFVFVTVLGAVLIQPILDAVDSTDPTATPTEPAEPDPTRSRAADAPAPTPEPSPSAGASDEVSGPLRTQPLFDRYPRRCLGAATARPDRLVFVADDLVQTATNFQADPGQGQVAASSLAGLNVTATTYASYTKPGDVLFAPWEGVAGADGARSGPRIEAAAWSPVSSCGLSLTSEGSLQVVPNGAVLVPEGVRHFAFSPDGRQVAVVIDEGIATSIWLTRLSGARMREVYRVEKGARLRIEGWAPDGEIVYFTRPGHPMLRFVDAAGSEQTGRIRGVADVRLEQCADRLVAVLDATIAELPGWRPFFYLTDGSAEGRDTAASCSPDGRFIAAIRDDSLVLLDSDGNLIRDLTTDGGHRDIDPDWGDSGAGLLFGRIPDGGGSAQVWHIPEGGVPRNTGLVYRPGPRAIDWSASPPIGLP